MKVLSILLLSTAAVIGQANEINQNLRGGDIQSNNNFVTERRELSENCVSSSTYLGCYADRNQNRAMSYEMEGRYSARMCEEACTEKGFLYFAREWRGQCFCDNEEHYDKHGSASGCDCCGTNVGANKMCVYKLQTESMYATAPGCTGRFDGAPYVGCYANRNRRRALPYEVHGKFHSAEYCQMECNKKGYKYFAREWRGQCFCGDYDYQKYGPESDCDCCGRNVGANKMCVWEGDGEGATTTTEATTTTTTTEEPVTVTEATEPANATTVGSVVEDEAPEQNIVEVAVEAGIFNTLVAAVDAAGLVDTLTSDGPFTVLAPTDDAFAKLPDGTIDLLLLEENLETLKEILLTHVIDGEVDSSMVTSGSVTTVSGNVIEAVVSDDGISFNDANVVFADIGASNGIVHVIDSVLLPFNLEA